MSTVEAAGAPLPEAHSYKALLLTSPRAIPFSTSFRAIPVYAVGRATAEAASHAGFTVAKVGGGELDDALLNAIPSGAKVLHLAGEDIASDPAPALQARGVPYQRVAVYRMVPATQMPDGMERFLHTPGRKA
ncbi:MAG: uroporphyrinogen-III synthase, partial [Pseudomonadota bacterium]